MPFLREGIDRVRVVPLPDGVAGDGQHAIVYRTALVTWRSSLTGVLYQLYVNGRLGGVTTDVEQRHLPIQTPCSLQSAVRVEVVAVEPRYAHISYAEELKDSAVSGGRVRLALLRSQTLPPGATANIYSDNGTGEVDYVEPVNGSPIPIWSCWQDKTGFGMAQFGTCDFGYEAAAAVGFGKGSFGRAQFGLDADVVEWISPVLPLGRYRFGVKVTDAKGNESIAGETEPVAVVPPSQPAARLDIASFDADTNQLVLGISDEP